ncbi:hypothetical protein [Flavobacterium sp. 3-210]
MEIIRLQQFQNDFNSVAEKSPNKPLVIEKELEEINKYLNFDLAETYKKPKILRFYSHPKPQRIFNINIPNYLRDIFSEAFNSYLTYGTYNQEKHPNEEIESFQKKLNTAEQAFELFEYYKWLKKQLTTKTKTKPSITLNHQEKILALHFLGMDTINLNATKTAKMLSAILGLDEQNTREILGALYINAVNNPVRTKKHFENLQHHFENIGLSEISKKIKDEISELK